MELIRSEEQQSMSMSRPRTLFPLPLERRAHLAQLKWSAGTRCIPLSGILSSGLINVSTDYKEGPSREQQKDPVAPPSMH